MELSIEFRNACEASHIDTDVLIAYAKDKGVFDFDIVKQAEDLYIGIYYSFRDYADEWADEKMACCGKNVPQFLMNYFDYEAHAKEMAWDYFTVDCKTDVAIFHNR
jgi:antirestriction protein